MILCFDEKYTDMSRIDLITFGDGYVEIVWKVKKDYDKAPITNVFGNSIMGKWLTGTAEGLATASALEVEFREAIRQDDRLFDFEEKVWLIIDRPGCEDLKISYEAFKSRWEKR